MEKVWNIGNDQIELDNRNANGIWRAKVVINRIDIVKCLEVAESIENRLNDLLRSYNDLNNKEVDEDVVLKKQKEKHDKK